MILTTCASINVIEIPEHVVSGDGPNMITKDDPMTSPRCCRCTWWSAGTEYLYLHNVHCMSLQKKRIQKVEPAYLEHSQVDPLCLLLLMPITNLLQLFLCQCQMDRKLRTDSRARICLSQTSLVIITQHAWCCTILFDISYRSYHVNPHEENGLRHDIQVSRSMLLQRIIDHWLGCLQDRTRCQCCRCRDNSHRHHRDPMVNVTQTSTILDSCNYWSIFAVPSSRRSKSSSVEMISSDVALTWETSSCVVHHKPNVYVCPCAEMGSRSPDSLDWMRRVISGKIEISRAEESYPKSYSMVRKIVIIIEKLFYSNSSCIFFKKRNP